MGLMDKMNDDMSADRARYAELSRMDQAGELDESGRMELQELRRRIEDSEI
jgi:hypothetical protein